MEMDPPRHSVGGGGRAKCGAQGRGQGGPATRAARALFEPGRETAGRLGKGVHPGGGTVTHSVGKCREIGRQSARRWRAGSQGGLVQVEE